MRANPYSSGEVHAIDPSTISRDARTQWRLAEYFEADLDTLVNRDIFSTSHGTDQAHRSVLVYVLPTAIWVGATAAQGVIGNLSYDSVRHLFNIFERREPPDDSDDRESEIMAKCAVIAQCQKHNLPTPPYESLLIVDQSTFLTSDVRFNEIIFIAHGWQGFSARVSMPVSHPRGILDFEVYIRQPITGDEVNAKKRLDRRTEPLPLCVWHCST